ncbi:MAG: hypothetical protein LBM17_09005 [Candidatus Accumulibacter sp.]|jgi:hypothetical protein|nr:hypothetical protein [Accumulibacter sp.]
MELNAPSLAVFDYNHGGRVALTVKRKYMFALALFLALVFARLLFPFGLIALAIPAMVYLRGERTLRIGPRYLICGDRIVYYANVKNLSFSEKDNSICLRTGLKTQLTIEEQRFRVKSRSPKEKVLQEKAQKFAEAVKLMTEGVHRFAPEAVYPSDAEDAAEGDVTENGSRNDPDSASDPAVPSEDAPGGEKHDE